MNFDKIINCSEMLSNDVLRLKETAFIICNNPKLKEISKYDALEFMKLLQFELYKLYDHHIQMLLDPNPNQTEYILTKRKMYILEEIIISLSEIQISGITSSDIIEYIELLSTDDFQQLIDSITMIYDKCPNLDIVAKIMKESLGNYKVFKGNNRLSILRNQLIYKFPLSPRGIYNNFVEIALTEKNISDKLHPIKLYCMIRNIPIVSSTLVNVYDIIDERDIFYFKGAIHQDISKYNIKIQDFYINNIAVQNGKLILIDYGDIKKIF